MKVRIVKDGGQIKNSGAKQFSEYLKENMK